MTALSPLPDRSYLVDLMSRQKVYFLCLERVKSLGNPVFACMKFAMHRLKKLIMEGLYVIKIYHLLAWKYE